MALDSPNDSRKEHIYGADPGGVISLILNLAQCLCPRRAPTCPESSGLLRLVRSTCTFGQDRSGHLSPGSVCACVHVRAHALAHTCAGDGFGAVWVEREKCCVHFYQVSSLGFLFQWNRVLPANRASSYKVNVFQGRNLVFSHQLSKFSPQLFLSPLLFLVSETTDLCVCPPLCLESQPA